MKIQQTTVDLNNIKRNSNSYGKEQGLCNRNPNDVTFGMKFDFTTELDRGLRPFATDSFNDYMALRQQEGKFQIAANPVIKKCYDKWHTIYCNLRAGMTSHNIADLGKNPNDFSKAFLESCVDDVSTPNMLSLVFWNGKGLKLQQSMPTDGSFSDVLGSVERRIKETEAINKSRIELLQSVNENLDNLFTTEKIEKVEKKIKSVMTPEEFERKLGHYKSSETSEIYFQRLLNGIDFKVRELETL